MRRLWFICGVSVAASLGFAAPVAVAQQNTTSQSQPSATAKSSDKTQKPASKDAAPTDAPAPATNAPQSAPDNTAAPPKKHSTAEDNPFPEDVSKKAAGEAAPDAPAPNANPPGDSSSRTGTDNLDLEGIKEKDGRQQLKLTSPDSGQPYDPKLAADDDRIGDYYLKAGNYPGAYARFKEACAADPGDAKAVFGLAEAARKMNKTREAADNYKIYLDAFPDGPKAKAARKALSELKVPPAP
jgi:tetratricopeptide (TPR) repeat protein